MELLFEFARGGCFGGAHIVVVVIIIINLTLQLILDLTSSLSISREGVIDSSRVFLVFSFCLFLDDFNELYEYVKIAQARFMRIACVL